MATSRKSELILWSSALLFAIGFSIVFGETILTSHDPANYVLAIRHGFNISLERPHAPGSPLLISLWQLVKLILPLSEHGIIVLCNSIFFGLSIVYTYKLFTGLKNKNAALATTLAFATNPVALYYASVAEVYSYEAFFATATIYYFLQCSASLLPVCMFFLGIAGGIRLSSVILLLPVIVFIVWNKKVSFSTLLFSTATFIIGIFCWLYPFYLRSGGIASITIALQQAGDLENSTIQNIATLGGFLVWGINSSVIGLFIRSRRESPTTVSKPTIVMLALWVACPILFFVFGHYAKGYILLVLPAILFLLTERFYRGATEKQFKLVILCIVGFQLSIFFLFPFIEPSIESVLPKSQRTANERLKTAALRATSFFAPTYSHITVADKEIKETVGLLTPTDKSIPIFIDRSATVWAYPRSLQALLPERTFLMGSNISDSLVTKYRGDSINRIASRMLITQARGLYFLIDSRLPEKVGSPPGSGLISKTDHLSLYYSDTEDKSAIEKYLLRDQ